MPRDDVFIYTYSSPYPEEEWINLDPKEQAKRMVALHLRLLEEALQKWEREEQSKVKRKYKKRKKP